MEWRSNGIWVIGRAYIPVTWLQVCNIWRNVIYIIITILARTAGRGMTFIPMLLQRSY
jgi:hypothetical protein